MFKRSHCHGVELSVEETICNLFGQSTSKVIINHPMNIKNIKKFTGNLN